MNIKQKRTETKEKQKKIALIASCIFRKNGESFMGGQKNEWVSK